jgi:hypothetical protein
MGRTLGMFSRISALSKEVTMGNIVDSVFKDGIAGILIGAGGLAKDLRTAITGNAPLSAEQKALLAQKASDLESAMLQAQVAIAKGQTDTNQIEAASSNIFKSGWRPGVGWVCVVGLAYQFIVMPVVPWVVGLWKIGIAPMPSLDMGTLITLLGGMLGLGTLRTIEKSKGIF